MLESIPAVIAHLDHAVFNAHGKLDGRFVRGRGQRGAGFRAPRVAPEPARPRFFATAGFRARLALLEPALLRFFTADFLARRALLEPALPRFFAAVFFARLAALERAPLRFFVCAEAP